MRILLFLFLLSSPAFAEVRTWTDSTGKHKVQAEFIEVRGESAYLKIGEVTKAVALTRLSEADQKYIKAQQEAAPDDPFDMNFGFRDTTAKRPDYPRPLKVVEGSSDAQGTLVYITASGKKYHNEGCRYLKGNETAVSLEELGAGYTPCSVCHPQAMGASHEHASTSKKALALSDKTSVAKPVETKVQKPIESPHGTSTGQTATGIPTYTGPRGGQYHYSKSGKKVYEKKK